MTLLAMGYSRAQVAETLSISEHTLRVYIESARFKLGAMNTTHAVAQRPEPGVDRGLIVTGADARAPDEPSLTTRRLVPLSHRYHRGEISHASLLYADRAAEPSQTCPTPCFATGRISSRRGWAGMSRWMRQAKSAMNMTR